jgi:hypothetical protein
MGQRDTSVMTEGQVSQQQDKGYDKGDVEKRPVVNEKARW